MTRQAKLAELQRQLARTRAMKYKLAEHLAAGSLTARDDKKIRRTLRNFEDLELELVEMLGPHMDPQW